MANEIAIAVWTRPGQEVILDDRAHALDWEMGAMAVVSSVLPRAVPTDQGIPDPARIEAALRGGPYYVAETGLIIVENTHNMWGGTVLPPKVFEAVAAVAHRHKIPLHLDGARLFNAATALARPVADLAAGCNSVNISLSKGLGAPVGSLLAGPAAFVAQARRVRKRLGGGWRQAGVLAAAGLVALEESPPLLAADHHRARRLSQAAAAAGLEIDPARVQTNIVVAGTGSRPAAGRVTRLAAAGVLTMAVASNQIRMVTHRDVDDAGIARACAALDGLAG
jgi:threonine aldolase